ncbi:MAG: carotenoid oxygenase family protein [Pseudolabrys sp.]|jgi:all-trans-8'-apo-beta-carotenal 15,15'-oxygenase
MSAVPDDREARPWSAGFTSLEQEFDYRVSDIDGQIPPALRGTLFRNGSGRNDLNGQWFPHWFDGDGMISAIAFDDGGIRYLNRYVRTDNYVNETREGRVLHRGFGKTRPGGILANAFRMSGNVSNTSVVLQGDQLLSLWEGGAPYALNPKTLQTFGVEDFGGRVRAFSAHPKVDPISGDLYNFGIDYGAKTTLTPYRIARNGALTAYPAIPLPYPVMNHDFVLTENYLVFCLGPILVHPIKFILGLASFDGTLHWDGTRPTLILLVRRDGSAPPRWIETDAFFQFHFANGFERDGGLVVDLTRYPDYLAIGQALRTYQHSEWDADGMASLARLRIDLASGKVGVQTFGTGHSNEFPRINPARTGRPYRCAYIANNPAGDHIGLQHCVTRIDMETGHVQSHDVGDGRYAGEPVFIPTGGGEDDGVVVTLVYDAAANRTDIVGLDARDLAARPLFTARLNHHVPYTLHGYFTPRLF